MTHPKPVTYHLQSRPASITSFEFDLLLVFNTGVGILIGEYGLGLVAGKLGRRPVLVLPACWPGSAVCLPRCAAAP